MRDVSFPYFLNLPTPTVKALFFFFFEADSHYVV